MVTDVLDFTASHLEWGHGSDGSVGRVGAKGAHAYFCIMMSSPHVPPAIGAAALTRGAFGARSSPASQGQVEPPAGPLVLMGRSGKRCGARLTPAHVSGLVRAGLC